MPGLLLTERAGLFYALRGPLAAPVRRFAVWEYRDSHKGIKRCVGPVNGLYGGFVFWTHPCPAGHGHKKCRPLAVGRRTSGGKLLGSIGTRADTLGGLEGMKNPALGSPRAGAGGIQDFFAVSQMIIKGRIKINRIIKWGPPP